MEELIPASPLTRVVAPPRQFRNGTWSCCAGTHRRPQNLTPRMKRAYEELYPHVKDWVDDLPDATTEILFGIGRGILVK